MNAGKVVYAVATHDHFRPFLFDVIKRNVISLERRPVLRLRVQSAVLALGSHAVRPCSALILSIWLAQVPHTELP